MGKHLDPGSNLLDLGTENPFTPQLKAAGYSVSNTQGENLDDDFKKIAQTACDCVTAFEIFEHLLAPYNILKELKKSEGVITASINPNLSKKLRSIIPSLNSD